MENARLLLASSRVHVNGVGNGRDLVGRYFMDHPVVTAAVLVPSSVREIAGKVALPRIIVAREARAKFGLFGVSMPFVPVSRHVASSGIQSYHALTNALGGEDVRGSFWRHMRKVIADFDMVMEEVSRKVVGWRLFDSADETGYNLLDCMLEQPPERENRIVLTKETDILGVPRILLKYRVPESVVASVWKTIELVGARLAEVGIGRLRSLEIEGERIWNETIDFGNHHMGTTRAHEDPRRGVVNGDLRVHGVDNLYVAGSSVFTAGGVCPPPSRSWRSRSDWAIIWARRSG